MKKIQKWVDIQLLKAECLPIFYMKEIEETFLALYDAGNQGEALEHFTLNDTNCLYHLEDEKDIFIVLEDPLAIEFVEVETIGKHRYFRIGKRFDHEMSLFYFMEGTLSKDIEQRFIK